MHAARGAGGRPAVVVCVAGLPGSGKSIVASAARRLGVPVLVMGDVVREEVARRGLEPTPENFRLVSRLLREERGPAAVAEAILPRLEALIGEGHRVVLVDGVRCLCEVDVFSRLACPVIVAVHASPRTRFERLRRRGRPGDPRSWEEFEARDRAELGFGLGDVIALADYMIVNEGGVEEARRRAEDILGALLSGRVGCGWYGESKGGGGD